MKHLQIIAVACLLSLPTWALGQKAPDLKTHADSISYALGMDVGTQIGKLDMPLNTEMIYQGLRDAFEGGETPLTEDDMRNLIMAFQRDLQMKQQEQMMAQAEKARAEGEVFLQENQAKEGVVTTESGLQYMVITPGTGASPTATSTVKVHYEGRLLDDSVFDSSIARGEPVEFPVNRVIAGWTEALQLMKTGAKWRLFIPYSLAYGAQGAPPNIGPYETLIFDVELLEVK